MKKYTFYYLDIIEVNKIIVEIVEMNETVSSAMITNNEYYNLWNKVEVIDNSEIGAFKKMLDKLPILDYAIFSKVNLKLHIKMKSDYQTGSHLIIELNRQLIDNNERLGFRLYDWDLTKKMGTIILKKFIKSTKYLKKMGLKTSDYKFLNDFVLVEFGLFSPSKEKYNTYYHHQESNVCLVKR